MSDRGPGQIPNYTLERTYQTLISKNDRAEPLTATELGERMNCTRRTALNKLNRLEKRGAVQSKKVGGRAKVWWVPLIDQTDIQYDFE